MFGDRKPGGSTTTVDFLTCDLSNLSHCKCMSSSPGEGSSSKRKAPSRPLPLIDPESLSPNTAKRLALNRPSLVDRLISWNKSALEMEGRRSVKKTAQALLPISSSKTKPGVKEPVKRKRAESLNGSTPAVKRLRSSQGGSESDSSPSRSVSGERKRVSISEKGEKSEKSRQSENINKGEKSVDKFPTNSNKPLEKKQSKPLQTSKRGLKKAENRFSTRIRFRSALRSGKKRQEFLEEKPSSKPTTKEPKEKVGKAGNDKTDSNSNVCTENDSENDTGGCSTDSEVSRDQSEVTGEKAKDKTIDDSSTRKRKKRKKRDSMWVKKAKKQLKGKVESVKKSLPPPSLIPEGPLCPTPADEAELPVLDRSDNSISLHNSSENPTSNDSVIQVDVSMPKLEVQIIVPSDKTKIESKTTSTGPVNKSLPHECLALNDVNTCERKNSPRTEISVNSINREVIGVDTFPLDQQSAKQYKQNENCVTSHQRINCMSVDKLSSAAGAGPKEIVIQTITPIKEINSSEIKSPVGMKAQSINHPTEISDTMISSKLATLNPTTDSHATEAESVNTNQIVGTSPLATPVTETVLLSKTNDLKCATDDKKNERSCQEHTNSNYSAIFQEKPQTLCTGKIDEPLKTECISAMQLAFTDSFSKQPRGSEKQADVVNHEHRKANDNETGQNPPGTMEETDGIHSLHLNSVASSSNTPDMVVRHSESSETNTCLQSNISDTRTEQLRADKDLKNHENIPGLCPGSKKDQHICDNNSENFSTCKSDSNSTNIATTVMPVESSQIKLEQLLGKSPIEAEITNNSKDKESVIFSDGSSSDGTVDKTSILQVETKPGNSIVNHSENLKDEINKLKAVLSEEPQMVENTNAAGNSNSGELTDSKLFEFSQNKVSINEPRDALCELTDSKIASNTNENVSHLDADSTSDMKQQSLDDSLNSFSLTFPDDLDLESSHSEREDESHVLPDSTECEKSDFEQSVNAKVPQTKKEDVPIAEKLETSSQPLDPEQPMEETQVTDTAIANLPDVPLGKELMVAKPLAGSTPRKLSEEPEKEVKPSEIKTEVLTVEERQMKESVLQALGLKSLSAPKLPTPAVSGEEKPKRDGYTGTLKAVIKLNRSGDKKKMVYQRTVDKMGALEYRICSEIPATDGVPITHLNDIAGIRKNVAKLHQECDANIGTTTTSNGHSDDQESSDDSKTVSQKDLIIPEKSASFSIHPGRLCSDVCTYCFGKFGSLDTPCHVAQLKAERQKKILESEPHLTAESCLCDACYRYVDRKANCPTKTIAGGSTKPRVKPPAMSTCCVKDCSESATHTVKKKWLVKLKKSITNKLEIDLDRPGAMYYPLCAQHHYWVDYFTVCGICRKRLNRNHLFSLGSETDRLNLMLAEDGIPARLSDKLFLCKLCRYYSNLRLKYADPSSIPHSGQIFYRNYRRKILTSLQIPVSDSEDELIKEEKKKPPVTKKTDASGSSNGAGSSTKSDDSVMALSNLATLLGDQPEQQARIQVKFGNVNIGRLSNLNIGQGGREERLPYSDIGLQASLEFEGPDEPTGSWERCVSTIQFDKRTKKLWQDLQKPYGNQSSFLRHLVMLEKYWRAGHLELTPTADERVIKYLNGVKNRIKAFEGGSISITDKPNPNTSSISNPPVTVTPVPSPAQSVPVTNAEKFPLLTNTGEIEVTPITIPKRSSAPPAVHVEKKHMTPLDRAKSLVRMIPPVPQRQRFPMPIQRYPMYVPYTNYQQQQPLQQQPQGRPPALIKLRSKSPSPYYQQVVTAHTIPIMPGPSVSVKPIMPKLPRALTVTHVPQGGAAIILNRSGITIEKQCGNVITPTLPNEKPSISVFREPAPGPS